LNEYKINKGSSYFFSVEHITKIFEKYKVTNLQELREKLDSDRPENDSNCFFGWTDEKDNASCPIMARDPTLTDENIAKRFCKICPRYLQVVGSKKITVERINTVVHSTPKGMPVNAGHDFVEKDWDMVFSQLITTDFQNSNYICNSCRVVFEILTKARSHVMDMHGSQYNSAINHTLQNRNKMSYGDFVGHG